MTKHAESVAPQNEADGIPEEEEKLGPGAYISLILIILFFSGIFGAIGGWLSFFDFGTLSGAFGRIGQGATAPNFQGSGGTGARGGFLFAFGLIPAVMFAIASVTVAEHYGALKAAQRLLTPILRPIMGIPGRAGLAMISSLQSTDAGASMTRLLKEERGLTDRQNSIFGAFQFSSGGIITNFLGTGAGLWALTNADGSPAIRIGIMVPFALQLILKIFGANLMRLYLGWRERGDKHTTDDVAARRDVVDDRPVETADEREKVSVAATADGADSATAAAPAAAAAKPAAKPAPVAAEEPETRNPTVIFVKGAVRGLHIGLNSVVPNVLMAYVVIKVFEVTGLMGLLGTVLGPIMGVFGLPGEAAAALLGSFLSMGGGVGVVGGLFQSGTLNGTHVAILAPAMFLMGSLLQYAGRLLAVIEAKHQSVMYVICFINAILAMWIMNFIV